MPLDTMRLWVLLAALCSAVHAFTNFVNFNRRASCTLSAGFGAAVGDSKRSNSKSLPAGDTTCPCASGRAYSDCCHPFHAAHDPVAVASTDPVSVVRARYSAYKLGHLDYIVASTSPSSPDYVSYIESPIGARSGAAKWKKDLQKTMLDPYVYIHMEVDGSEPVDGEEGAVVVQYRHLAIQKKDNTMYPVCERALLKRDRATGTWGYVKSDVSRPLPEQAKTMMEEWPGLAGLELKKNEFADIPGLAAAAAEGPRRQAVPKQRMTLPANAGKKRG